MSKREGRLSVADWFLILLALLSVGGLLLRLWKRDGEGGGELQHFLVTVRWENVDSRTVGCLQSGEVLYMASGEEFGVVRLMDATPTIEGIRSNGTYYQVQSLSRVTVILEIEMEGRLSEGRLFARYGELLSAGQSILLYSRRSEIPLKILSYRIDSLPQPSF